MSFFSRNPFNSGKRLFRSYRSQGNYSVVIKYRDKTTKRFTFKTYAERSNFIRKQRMSRNFWSFHLI